MSDRGKAAAAKDNPEGQARYSGDHPIQNPSEDRFNRWPFAKRIADTLRDREDPACIVLGIYGAWGEGKTSVLNLIGAELKKSEKVAVVPFNPWYFSSEAVLIKGLFEALAEGAGKKLAGRREQFGEALEKLGTILSIASISVGSIVSVNPGEAVSKMGSELSQTELAESRKRIQAILREAGVRVVVLIDDIDRLERQEIQALFKTVRLSADFERVTYILAFDRDVVAASLGERYGGGDASQGAAFLEKIIQVPLHLPPAKKKALRQIVFDGTDAALRIAGIDITREQGETIGIQLTQGLESRLFTPRHAYLFTNALLFALPILKGEVNVVDQVLVEGLRIFYPRIYEAVRSSPQLFLRARGFTFDDKLTAEKTKNLLEEAQQPLAAQQREDVQTLLEYLFPRIGRTVYGEDWEVTWARAQRICSWHYFDRYFTYGVDSSEVSDMELASFLATLEKSSPLEARRLWEEFVLPERMEAIIEKLRQRVGKIKDVLAERVVTAIAEAGESLPLQEDQFAFLSTLNQAAILISLLISGLPELEARAALADSALSVAKPLPFGAEILRWLQPSPTKDRTVLKEEDLKRVGDNFTKRIEEECRSEWLFSKYKGKAVALLWTWKQYGGEDAVRTYVSEGLRQDIGRLDEFLESFVGQAYSSGLPAKTDLSRLSYDNIASVVAPEIVNDLVMQAYGSRIQLEQYHFDDETPDGLRIANQFAYVHLYVAKEKEAAVQPDESD